MWKVQGLRERKRPSAHGNGDSCFRRQIAGGVDGTFAGGNGFFRPLAEQLRMDFQRISGENFLAEFDIVDAKKQGYLAGIGRLGHQNEICGLGSGLHSVYAGENGAAGEVALENLPGRVPPEGGGDALAGYQLVDLVDQQHRNYKTVEIIANSIGAYFAINALSNQQIEKAYFISPIVDMERLIADMMIWANVTEDELKEKKEIQTTFGETLSWDYLCYVRENPIIWKIPTHILYGEKGNLTAYGTIFEFVQRTNSTLSRFSVYPMV